MDYTTRLLKRHVSCALLLVLFVELIFVTTGYENDRLRHIRLHEQVNELPDPNYATLKYFMGHLDRLVRVYSRLTRF